MIYFYTSIILKNAITLTEYDIKGILNILNNFESNDLKVNVKIINSKKMFKTKCLDTNSLKLPGNLLNDHLSFRS